MPIASAPRASHDHSLSVETVSCSVFSEQVDGSSDTCKVPLIQGIKARIPSVEVRSISLHGSFVNRSSSYCSWCIHRKDTPYISQWTAQGCFDPDFEVTVRTMRLETEPFE
jgi:hypothetical protein